MASHSVAMRSVMDHAVSRPRLFLLGCVCSIVIGCSFAEALHSEMEVWGVGVTCLMPGATRTNFEENSGSSNALVWRLPFFVHEAHEVSCSSPLGWLDT